MNLAFYTCFYGSDTNTSFTIPILPSYRYPCYYYTNNQTMMDKLKKTKWIPIFDPKAIEGDDMFQSNMAGKHVRVLPHEYKELLPYTYLCYLDNKLEAINDVFIDECIQKYFIDQHYALIIREHHFVHDSVWNEYIESQKQERYIIESPKYKKYIEKQVRAGFNEKTMHHAATGFLLRNMRHEHTNNMNLLWYSHIQQCGLQDQISFFFVKQLFEGSIYFLTESPFHNYYYLQHYTSNLNPAHQNQDPLAYLAQKDAYVFCKTFMLNYGLKNVIDIGCKSGKHLVEQLKDFHTIGIDTEEFHTDLINAYPDKRWILSGAEEVAFLTNENKEDPDMVLSMNAIQHIRNPNGLLDYLLGFHAKYYIISTPCRFMLCHHPRYKNAHAGSWNGPPTNPYHAREWTMNEFQQFLRTKFKIIASFYGETYGEYQYHVVSRL